MSSDKVARLFIKHSIMLIQGIDANASKHSSPEHRVHGSRVKRQRTVLILTCEETTPQRVGQEGSPSVSFRLCTTNEFLSRWRTVWKLEFGERSLSIQVHPCSLSGTSVFYIARVLLNRLENHQCCTQFPAIITRGEKKKLFHPFYTLFQCKTHSSELQKKTFIWEYAKM